MGNLKGQLAMAGAYSSGSSNNGVGVFRVRARAAWPVHLCRSSHFKVNAVYPDSPVDIQRKGPTPTSRSLAASELLTIEHASTLHHTNMDLRHQAGQEGEEEKRHNTTIGVPCTGDKWPKLKEQVRYCDQQHEEIDTLAEVKAQIPEAKKGRTKLGEGGYSSELERRNSRYGVTVTSREAVSRAEVVVSNCFATGGKCNRGLSVIDSYKTLKGVDVLSKEETFLACTLGWCIEWLQAYFLVLDDIMDNSQTRRGQPCWFRVPQVGLIAVNDGIILRNHISRILQRHFRGNPYYVDLIDLFNEMVSFRITQVSGLLHYGSELKFLVVITLPSYGSENMVFSLI
ncbi:farnesyl pyrophosphate synthase [Hordeum vulgare]|nr:farnesyl pyrophosphate synthase [Hordeum vulgare]